MRGHACRTTAWLLLVSTIGCGGSDPPREQPARPVKTMVVAAGDETHTRSFPGKVEASRKAELAFQVSGLLEKLPVKEGQRVAKGEVIAELRLEEFQARLKALQSQLDQARAALRGLQAGERPEQQRRLEAQVRAARARLEMPRLNTAQRLPSEKAALAARRRSLEGPVRRGAGRPQSRPERSKGNHRSDRRHRGARRRSAAWRRGWKAASSAMPPCVLPTTV